MKRLGPLPRFSESHIRKALELIDKYRKLNRKHLSKELGIGEGSTRTLLDKLKKRGLVYSRPKVGHMLTAKGKRFLGKPAEFVQIDAGDLTVGHVDVATIVRGAANKVKLGIEQRDEAIKAGADGATVLIFKKGKFQFPNGFKKIDKRLSETLMKIFNPREQDVILIGTSRDALRAELGARAAARGLRKCFKNP